MFAKIAGACLLLERRICQMNKNRKDNYVCKQKFAIYNNIILYIFDDVHIWW